MYATVTNEFPWRGISKVYLFISTHLYIKGRSVFRNWNQTKRPKAERNSVQRSHVFTLTFKKLITCLVLPFIWVRQRQLQKVTGLTKNTRNKSGLIFRGYCPVKIKCENCRNICEPSTNTFKVMDLSKGLNLFE